MERASPRRTVTHHHCAKKTQILITQRRAQAAATIHGDLLSTHGRERVHPTKCHTLGAGAAVGAQSRARFLEIKQQGRLVSVHEGVTSKRRRGPHWLAWLQHMNRMPRQGVTNTLHTRSRNAPR